ncbi:MAG: rRNA maturation RNase YbeY [Chlorobiaceae bacterium]
MTLQIHNTTRQKIPVKLLGDAVRLVLKSEGYLPAAISGVYCGNAMIRRINREYLQHDYPTDTITFSYSGEREVEGEYYISLDVVRENARRFSVEFHEELLRVTVHSALHLIGYLDTTPEERQGMQEKEAFYLNRIVR